MTTFWRRQKNKQASGNVDQPASTNQLLPPSPGTAPQPSEPPASKEELRKLAFALFDQFEAQIQRADFKAQLILAADALLVAGLTPLAKGAFATLWAGIASTPDRLAALFTLDALAALLLSLYYALWVVRPQLGSTQTSSLVYFGEVAKRSEISFTHDFLNQSPKVLEDSMLAEVHAKARIAADKYARVHASVNFLIAVVTLWGGVEIMLAISTGK